MIIMPAISPSPNPSFGLGWDLGQLGLGLGYDSGRGEKVVNTVAGRGNQKGLAFENPQCQAGFSVRDTIL